MVGFVALSIQHWAYYCLTEYSNSGITISTRRLSSRPLAVALEATGLFSPSPFQETRDGSIPRSTIASATALARYSDRVWLYAADPDESVCPVTTTFA